MTLSAALILGLALTGAVAGVLGALMGIGGGIIVVPALVLIFGFDIKIAIAASLVAVVASSTAAGSVYVGKGLANMRLGMLLEIATTLGGISGGVLAVYVAPNFISMLFAFLLLITSFLIFRTRDQASAPKAAAAPAAAEGHEERGSLAGSFYDTYSRSVIYYQVERIFLGSGISFFAGIMSGMLGVGGGFVKVPAMNLGMKVPIKVATATSNFMIGVTAVSSLVVYFTRGLVYPAVAAPVALGVVGGALWGTRWAQRVSPGSLKKIFAVLLTLVALQMLLTASGVNLGK